MTSLLQHYYLAQMGISTWVLRQNHSTPRLLQQLAVKVSACKACPLHAVRTQTVFARGNPHAKLMLIGEAPGLHEDQQGLPFVGKAGILLNNMLAGIGFAQDEVYIANILKCRPPNNRDPDALEISQCSPYLAQQIDLIQPQLIVALGRYAAQYLLNSTASLHSMRLTTHNYQGIPVVVSYHPAYLLRNPRDKKKAYQDWIQIKKIGRFFW